MEAAVGMAETKQEMDSNDSIEAEVPQEIVKLLTPPEAAEVGRVFRLACISDVTTSSVCLCDVHMVDRAIFSHIADFRRQAEDAQLNGSNGAHADVKSKAAA